MRQRLAGVLEYRLCLNGRPLAETCLHKARLHTSCHAADRVERREPGMPLVGAPG